MVMKRNRMTKNLLRSIQRSFGRYIAIVAIIALGCCLFVALRVTKTDMVETGQQYTDQQNMFDLQLLSTYGWTDESVDAIRNLPGISGVEGGIYVDALVHFDYKQSEGAYRLYAIPENINKVHLLGGRMPQSPDECLIDGDGVGDFVLGTTVTVADGNEEDTLDSLTCHTYTVVGYISTPLYMDMTRGSTTLGNGSLISYIYLPRETFDVDYYTEIYVTIPGDWRVYSQEYTDALEAMAKQLEVDLIPIADQRFQAIKTDAMEQWEEGHREYLDGLQEYEDGKLEAEQKLAEALAELESAQKQLEDGWAQFLEGEAALNDGQAQLDAGLAELEAGALALEQSKAEAYTQFAQAYTTLLENYKTVSTNLALVNDGLAQIDEGLRQIDDGLLQIEESLPLLQMMIEMSKLSVNSTQSALNAATVLGNEELITSLQKQLDEQTATLTEYQTQLDTVLKTQKELQAKREEVVGQRAELAKNQKTLNDAMAAIELGFTELETNKQVAENQFAAAEAQMAAGRLELQAAQAEIDANRVTLEASRQELQDAENQLAEGWKEYEDGKLEAEAELADAKAQLDEAEAELLDAKKQIEDMAQPVIYAMTRNTNAGYLALDSNSDIVDGISDVLPVFFLLIAALVCITTMTRMVEEERTQIGTLKALGYSSGAIMSKYLWYSGSASMIGCVLGMLLGCYALPNVLWEAYKMIFNITPDMVLMMDWKTGIFITVAYLAVSSFVTWYCCNRTLKEVPAELIRPKTDKLGKKIFLERLPFWHKLSFLNKVMLRNVFRYGQRLAMMVIGIGGCTALLLTGFGLRDTVCNVANIQFEEVSIHDMQVYFDGAMDVEEQIAFQESLKSEVQNVGFFYQTSAKLEFNGEARDLYMICSDAGITDFMSFHRGEEPVSVPGVDQALLSVGVTELLGIGIGDTITLMDSDMKAMTLTVSGIYDNHVNNYVVINPQTLQKQWNMEPEYQMCFVKAQDTADLDALGEKINSMDNVLSVIVNADSAEMVANMMEALDLVVWVIVFCAGLLAAIVLYNLTNININERIREIATIKVLGFNAGETASYVFKENILLTFFGIIFGLGLGVWFLDFVMMHIKVDMVWFSTRLTVPSYIYSVILTLLCATVVDFIFYHLLEKINMAEALKSVE